MQCLLKMTFSFIRRIYFILDFRHISKATIYFIISDKTTTKQFHSMDLDIVMHKYIYIYKIATLPL